LGVLLCGCAADGANSDDAHRDEPDVGVVAYVDSPTQIVRPIDEFMPTNEQTVAIFVQYLELVQTCVVEAGSDLRVGLQDGSGSHLSQDFQYNRAREFTHSQTWGLFNPDDVQQVGYGDGRDVTLSWLEPSGPVVQDCAARVASVAPPGTPIFDRPEALPGGGPESIMADSRYQEAEAEWAECMAENGFDYATPIEAIANNYMDPKTATAMAVANADVACKISTNLVGKAVAIQSAYDNLYIEENRDVLQKMMADMSDFIAGRVIVPDVAPQVEEDPSPTATNSDR
jgi:hypothetical protein